MNFKILTFLILTGSNIYSQFNGDWYCVGAKYTKLEITDDYIVSSSFLDTIGSQTSKNHIDSIIIDYKQKVKNKLYFIGYTRYGNSFFDKFIFDKKCKCIHVRFVDSEKVDSLSIDKFDSLVKNDNTVHYIATFYKEKELSKFKTLKKINDVDSSGLLKILTHQLKGYNYMDELTVYEYYGYSYAKNSDASGSFVLDSFVSNGYSPFLTPMEFHEVLSKFQTNKEIKDVLQQILNRFEN